MLSGMTLLQMLGFGSISCRKVAGPPTLSTAWRCVSNSPSTGPWVIWLVQVAA